jgi:hypothetical protein
MLDFVLSIKIRWISYNYELNGLDCSVFFLLSTILVPLCIFKPLALLKLLSLCCLYVTVACACVACCLLPAACIAGCLPHVLPADRRD